MSNLYDVIDSHEEIGWQVSARNPWEVFDEVFEDVNTMVDGTKDSIVSINAVDREVVTVHGRKYLYRVIPPRGVLY